MPQNTATKPGPAQYNSVQISLVSYWMEPTGRLHVSLNSISTALSCSLHPAVRSGKAPRLHKKEYFVSEKKKSTMYLANSQAMSWQRRQFPCSRVLCILMINSCGWIASGSHHVSLCSLCIYTAALVRIRERYNNWITAALADNNGKALWRVHMLCLGWQ